MIQLEILHRNKKKLLHIIRSFVLFNFYEQKCSSILLYMYTEIKSERYKNNVRRRK